jgi:hypothetical protein
VVVGVLVAMDTKALVVVVVVMLVLVLVLVPVLVLADGVLLGSEVMVESAAGVHPTRTDNINTSNSNSNSNNSNNSNNNNQCRSVKHCQSHQSGSGRTGLVLHSYNWRWLRLESWTSRPSECSWASTVHGLPTQWLSFKSSTLGPVNRACLMLRLLM